MQIQVREITPPRPANVEKGWKAGKTYKITDINNINYYANPEFISNISEVKENDKIAIKFKETAVAGKPMNFVEKIEFLVIDPNTTPAQQSQAPTTNYVEEGTAGGYNVSDLDSRAWSIILQACVNRYQDWTPDQKLRWVCIHYSAGAENTFKKLQDTHDLDNTAISEMPDDKIPF